MRAAVKARLGNANEEAHPGDRQLFDKLKSHIDRKAYGNNMKESSGQSSRLFSTLRDLILNDELDTVNLDSFQPLLRDGHYIHDVVDELRKGLARQGRVQAPTDTDTHCRLMRQAREEGANGVAAQVSLLKRYSPMAANVSDSDLRQVAAQIRDGLANYERKGRKAKKAFDNALEQILGKNQAKVLDAFAPYSLSENDAVIEDNAEDDFGDGRDEGNITGEKNKDAQSETKEAPRVRFIGSSVESARKALAADAPVDPNLKNTIEQHGGFWEFDEDADSQREFARLYREEQQYEQEVRAARDRGVMGAALDAMQKKLDTLRAMRRALATRKSVRARFLDLQADLRRTGNYVRELTPLEYAEAAGVSVEKVARALGVEVESLEHTTARMLAVEPRLLDKPEFEFDPDALKSLGERSMSRLSGLPESVRIEDPATADALEVALKREGAAQRKALAEMGYPHAVRLRRTEKGDFLENNKLHGGNGVFAVIREATDVENDRYAAETAGLSGKALADKRQVHREERRTWVYAPALIEAMRAKMAGSGQETNAPNAFNAGISALLNSPGIAEVEVYDIWGRKQEGSGPLGAFGEHFQLEPGLTYGWATGSRVRKTGAPPVHPTTSPEQKLIAAEDAAREQVDAMSDFVAALSGKNVDLKTLSPTAFKFLAARAEDAVNQIQAGQANWQKHRLSQRGIDAYFQRLSALLSGEQVSNTLSTRAQAFNDAVHEVLAGQIETLEVAHEDAQEAVRDYQKQQAIFEGEGEREGIVKGTDGRMADDIGSDFNDDGTPKHPYGAEKRREAALAKELIANFKGVRLSLRPGVKAKHFTPAMRQVLAHTRDAINAIPEKGLPVSTLNVAADYIARAAAANMSGDRKAMNALIAMGKSRVFYGIHDAMVLTQAEALQLDDANRAPYREAWTALKNIGQAYAEAASNYEQVKADVQEYATGYAVRGAKKKRSPNNHTVNVDRKPFHAAFDRDQHRIEFLATLADRSVEEIQNDMGMREARIQKFSSFANRSKNLETLLEMMREEQGMAQSELATRGVPAPARAMAHKAPAPKITNLNKSVKPAAPKTEAESDYYADRAPKARRPDFNEVLAEEVGDEAAMVVENADGTPQVVDAEGSPVETTREEAEATAKGEAALDVAEREVDQLGRILRDLQQLVRAVKLALGALRKSWQERQWQTAELARALNIAMRALYRAAGKSAQAALAAVNKALAAYHAWRATAEGTEAAKKRREARKAWFDARRPAWMKKQHVAYASSTEFAARSNARNNTGIELLSPAQQKVADLRLAELSSAIADARPSKGFSTNEKARLNLVANYLEEEYSIPQAAFVAAQNSARARRLSAGIALFAKQRGVYTDSALIAFADLPANVGGA